MPLSELNLSLAAVRIPCAAAVKDGASEYETGLTGKRSQAVESCTGCSVFMIKYDNESISEAGTTGPPNVGPDRIPATGKRKAEPVTDHMLVCLPEDAGANGYTSDQPRIGDLYLLFEKCAKDDFQVEELLESESRDWRIVQSDGQTFYVGAVVDLPGHRVSVQLVNMKTFQLRGRTVQYEQSSACFVARVGIPSGSQCLGSACVTDAGGQLACGSLPSCLDGLAAWSNIWSLGNADRIMTYPYRKIYSNPTPYDAYQNQLRRQMYYSAGHQIRPAQSHAPQEPNSFFKTMHFPVSSSGPRGGPSAATPDGQPVGHGGDGRCPELVPHGPDRLAPMARAVPRHVEPQQGENGMAMFYDCDLDVGNGWECDFFWGIFVWLDSGWT
eukprot:Skav232512  [mRNA]  locus=scaffold1096:642305:643866:+ [translate_table: standard]